MTYTQLNPKAAALDRWWLFFAHMHSINSIIPGVKLEVLTQKANDILTNLQQAGLFRAVVIQRSGNSVLLDTAFGTITAKAPDKLQKGDAIIARVLPGKPELTLKIEQHTPTLISLPRSSLNALIRQNISLPVIARVVTQQAHNTQLKIGNQSIKIPRMEALQNGQRVLLQANSQQQLELKALYPENILKTALSTLVPKNLKNSSGHNLFSLQKLSSELLVSDTRQLQQRALLLSAQSATKTGTQNQANPPSAAPPEKLPMAQPGSAATGSIKLLLETLASPMLKTQGIQPQSIQQLLILLSLLKPTASQHSSNLTKSLPETLLNLMNALKTSPDSFSEIIKQAFEHRSSANEQRPGERSPLQIANILRNDLLTQTEQTLNQLLTQKSTLALQVEQNQPIQLNLAIPIQVNDQTRNLKLKIREKKKQQQLSEQHWEIHLSFEFSLLGLISTHILLQDTQLSAHFRVQREETRDLINSHMHEFKAQLEQNGFELGLFDCRQGQATEEDEPGPLRSGDNFVDIKV